MVFIMNLMILFFFLLIVRNSVLAETTTLCTADFCKNYDTNADEPKCPEFSKLCNETLSNSGLFLPSATICNCCPFCLGYLKKGESCSTGETSNQTPDNICGPGLTCDGSTSTCQKMSDKIIEDGRMCTNDQKEYDFHRKAGDLGEFQLRPECDDDGYYVPYKCVPGQICYCVDKYGNRIFGEVDNDGLASMLLQCSCSKNFEDMKVVLGRDIYLDEYFRCAANGGYDRIQCMGESCLCVDEIDGAPTFPASAFVEVAAISNKTLPCFNKTVHTEGTYLRKCQAEYLDEMKEVRAKKNTSDFVFAYRLPKCSLDGKYARVQEDFDKKYCANPDTGEPMEDYIVTKSVENKILLDEMNCNCAITAIVMSATEKPACKKNGNFNEEQVRRGKHYMVDENGNQITLLRLSD